MDEKEYFLSVGKYIADKRKEKNLTQIECCSVTDISRSTMSDIEKGVRLPNSKDMLSICKVLQLTPNDIYSYGSADHEFSSVKNDEDRAKDDLILLLKTSVSFFKLSNQSKGLISSLIYRIAEDEIGPGYIKSMERLETIGKEIIESEGLRNTVINKVNIDRANSGIEPLRENEIGTAMKEFMDIMLNGWTN